MSGPLRIFAKCLPEAGPCVPCLWEAARPPCAAASSGTSLGLWLASSHMSACDRD